MPSKRRLIVDAGSGTGIYTIALAKRGCDVILLDYSKENLKANREEIEKAE
ncbi:MAG: class I SAM-dependent methyltransferase [Thermoplasmataceae archaeon]